jgi:hypothetical protein
MLGPNGSTKPLPAGAGNHGRHDTRSEQPGLWHVAGNGRIVRLDGGTRRILYRHGSERADAAVAIGSSQDRKRNRSNEERGSSQFIQRLHPDPLTAALGPRRPSPAAVPLQMMKVAEESGSRTHLRPARGPTRI